MIGTTPPVTKSPSLGQPTHAGHTQPQPSVLPPNQPPYTHPSQQTSPTSNDSTAFYRLIQRVVADLNEALRLSSLPSVQTVLASNVQTGAYIAGQIASTERALIALSTQIQSFPPQASSFTAAGQLDAAAHAHWVLSHGLRADTQQELGTCHASLLLAVATMRQWASAPERLGVPVREAVGVREGDEIDDLLELLRSPYRRRRERERRKAELAELARQAGPLPQKTVLSFPGLSGIGSAPATAIVLPSMHNSEPRVPQSEQVVETSFQAGSQALNASSQASPQQNTTSLSMAASAPPTVAQSQSTSTHTSPLQPHSELAANSPAIGAPTTIAAHSSYTSPSRPRSELAAANSPTIIHTPPAAQSPHTSTIQPHSEHAASNPNLPTSASNYHSAHTSPQRSIQETVSSVVDYKLPTHAIELSASASVSLPRAPRLHSTSSTTLNSLPTSAPYHNHSRAASTSTLAASPASAASLPSTTRPSNHYRTASHGAFEMDSTPAQSSTNLAPAAPAPRPVSNETLPADSQYPILIPNSGMWIRPPALPLVPDRENYPEVYIPPPATTIGPTLSVYPSQNNALAASYATFPNVSSLTVNSNASTGVGDAGLDAYRNPTVGYPAATTWQQPSSLAQDRNARRARRAALEDD